jgi:murein L,D-transpeptidase YafK
MMERTLHRTLRTGLICLTLLLPVQAPAMGTRMPDRFGTPAVAPQDINDLLAQALLEISESRLDAALRSIETVLGLRPNFRLAHLIRGDLLLARARPLTGLGSADDARPQEVDALREEARVRLLHFLENPPAGKVPAQLLQMQAGQRYGIVVDAKDSRLYLFENIEGEPRLIRDFYVTIGANGVDKLREGDRKTPLGVYFVTGSLKPAKLGDFYGAGAFPINYPNGWDKAKGKSGHGIWLHGTPSDTYSRPPRASDGCIVLANPDLRDLSRYLQVGVTPVIITQRMQWKDRAEWQSERDALLAQLDLWRRDWEARDVQRYLDHYSEDFVGPGKSREIWTSSKRIAIEAKRWIRIGLDNVSVFRHPGPEDMAVVTFDQDFDSDRFESHTRKRQYWKLEGGRWRIVMEDTLYTRSINNSKA